MTDLRRLAALIAARDPAAADELDIMADKLRALAARLRAGENPNRSTGGATDRVQMNVFGPDGTLKRRVDTAE